MYAYVTADDSSFQVWTFPTKEAAVKFAVEDFVAGGGSDLSRKEIIEVERRYRKGKVVETDDGIESQVVQVSQ